MLLRECPVKWSFVCWLLTSPNWVLCITRRNTNPGNCVVSVKRCNCCFTKHIPIITWFQLNHPSLLVRYLGNSANGYCYQTRCGCQYCSSATQFIVAWWAQHSLAELPAPFLLSRKWGGLGWLRGTQGQRQCHHSIERIRLLFDFNRNYASMFYSFWDIADY